MQAVLGAFHHFELARELQKRRYLETIFSTFPWARLKREGIPRAFVKTFPYIHGPQMLIGPYIRAEWFHRELNVATRYSLNRWVEYATSRRPAPDAFISLSGAVTSAAERLQERGTTFICDRGSTHQVYQEQILIEEALRWGLTPRIPDPRLRETELRNYQAADAITIPTHACARSFVEQGVAPGKLHIIPYGVRLEQFFRVADPPTDSFEVLFVGGVSLRKGVPYLLQAFAALKHPRKQLTVIGAPNLELEPLLPSLPTENVRFLGRLPQTKVIEHMSRSHVMVMPSIEEGLALVQGQAMACGCPVLATTATGAEDLYTDGVEGFIVPIRDAQVLTDRMQQLADDPELRARMGAASLERVKSLGGWQHYGDLWQTLLQSLTGKN